MARMEPYMEVCVHRLCPSVLRKTCETLMPPTVGVRGIPHSWHQKSLRSAISGGGSGIYCHSLFFPKAQYIDGTHLACLKFNVSHGLFRDVADRTRSFADP